ncbi:glycine betaine ABC transporter substrate-binding protein [Oleiagrimonas sp. C23AA]|uniref:ABC transporter permease/substrate-binding protein n=1 Tax=Oleiagrimonas sp. C23AA TaxID=2719047 RepID=UPI0014248408|nr:glycine betaine ABC transporter substrate-binding protein [Oleiagrimonas sp. C23AA]NII09321.1 ABC transporter permease subunit [Oleiagrimonas sp. C23AA]
MRRALHWVLAACLALGLALAASAATAAGAPVRIGSKAFTESIVLGEVARLELKAHSIAATHQRNLGGTRILWKALRRGSIDVYPEYTGTLVQELLPGAPSDASLAQLRARLKRLGLGMSAPLGFSDSYALGMPRKTARQLGIERISQLRAHPQVRYGLSNEFMDREDGWRGLARRYGLPTDHVRSLDHDLAYKALAAGAIDVTDVYTTDAEIPYQHLRVLTDDRHFFPSYRAVFLYRLDWAASHPQALAALNGLGGRIDEAAMQRMNAAVKLDGRSETAVAGDFLGVKAASGEAGFWTRLGRRTLEHLALVASSLGLAIVIALPLGLVAARYRRLGQGVMALTGVLQTVPSLALFVFMIPLFGIGAAPAIAALFLYSLLPIVRNTHVGLTGIDPALLASADALGLPRRVKLWRIDLPLALRSILAGVKVAAVINVGTATLGALIGAGGYGQPILTGIRLDDMGLILQGAIPAAVLALAVQGIFELVERGLVPRGLRPARPRRARGSG